MSRFSGLPEPRRDVEPENGSRAARIRAAVAGTSGSEGRRFDELLHKRSSARLTTASGETAATQPATPTPAAKLPTSKPVASAPAPKREAWKVPAEITAKGASAEFGYRIAYEAVSDQLGRMSTIPGAKGRVGSLIEMVAFGASDAEIRAGISEMPTDRQRQISATWDGAIAAVWANRGMTLSRNAEANGPQPRDAARQRMIAVANDDLFVGNEAKALGLLTKEGLYGLSAADMLEVLALSTGSDHTAEAVWDRANAAVFGTASASKSDPHGWQAIHAEIRERRR